MGPIQLTPYFALYYGISFAVLTSALTTVFLFHWQDIRMAMDARMKVSTVRFLDPHRIQKHISVNSCSLDSILIMSGCTRRDGRTELQACPLVMVHHNWVHNGNCCFIYRCCLSFTSTLQVHVYNLHRAHGVNSLINIRPYKLPVWGLAIALVLVSQRLKMFEAHRPVCTRR